jgi:hypothetical protein
LSTIAIPASVTSIGDYAFSVCSDLATITIAATVTNIGDYAFYDCASLANVFFQGSAPTVDTFTFSSDANATAYYFPGTTGWATEFAGIPAVLWNPVIQTTNASFGVQDDQFGFNITGTTNIPIAIEACDNLAAPVWTPIHTLTLTNGSYYFAEPLQTNSSTRFYRISPPGGFE